MLLFSQQMFMICVCVCVCVCMHVCACVCVVHLYFSAQLSLFNMEKH